MGNIHEELIMVDVDAKDYEDAIRKVGKKLFDNGYVKDTYIDAVVAREAEFPTGLKLEGIEIAMPHTAGVHVNEPAVCVAKLRNPVVFSHMGEPETKVNATLLFMMAIKNPDEQIDTLQSVMGVFTNKEAIEELKTANTESELFSIAKKYIK